MVEEVVAIGGLNLKPHPLVKDCLLIGLDPNRPSSQPYGPCLPPSLILRIGLSYPLEVWTQVAWVLGSC